MWDTVKEANIQGEDFKNIVRIFVLSDDLRMTRQNVASADKFTFSFWNKQRILQKDSDYIENNINILCSFKNSHCNDIQIKRYGTGAPFSIISSDFLTVYKEILERFILPGESKLNNSLVAKLKTLLSRKDLNPNIDVIWMRDLNGNTSKHHVREDGTIPNYSVGRRPEDYSKPAIYLGDDNQFKKANTMQLQIHMIEDTNSGIISPTLALYLPTEVVSGLTNLVIKS